MFEGNSLSSAYYLRDLERQYKGAGLRDHRPDRKPDPALRHSHYSNASGLLAYAAVFLVAGGLFWL